MSDLLAQLNARVAATGIDGMTDQEIGDIQQQGREGTYRGPQQQNLDENGGIVTVGQNKAQGALLSVLNGALSEFGDEVAGTAAAAGASLAGQPGTFSENKRAFTDEFRRQEQLYGQTNPTGAFALKGLGIVGSALGVGGAAKMAGMKIAPTVMGRATQGSIAGGVGGGLTGAGEAETNQEIGGKAATGAALGVVVGGAASPVIEGMMRVGSPAMRRAWAAIAGRTKSIPQNKVAEDLLLEAMALDGLTPAILRDRLASPAFAGKPATIADVGGENMASVAEWAFGSAGASKQAAAKMFRIRDSEHIDRFMADAAENLTDGRAFFDSFEALAKQRADDAAPLYKVAFDQEVLFNKRLAGVMRRPAALKAWGKAKEMALEAGDKPLDNVADWRALHYVQRALRDIQRGEARTNAAEDMARQVGGTRKALLQEMDRLNPRYKEARNLYADQSSVIDAMENGLSILKAEGKTADSLTESTVRAIKAMSDGEREAYRLGASRALLSEAYAPAGERRISRKILNDPRIREKLGAAWEDKPALNRFIERLGAEITMAARQNKIAGGSPTMARKQVEEFATRGTRGIMGAASDVAEEAANLNAGTMIRTAIRNSAKRASAGQIVERASALTPVFDINPSAREAYIQLLEKAANRGPAPRLPGMEARPANIGLPLGAGATGAQGGEALGVGDLITAR